MLASAFITLREGLEAALSVGIVLGVLRKLGHTDRSWPVWAGVWAVGRPHAAVALEAVLWYNINY